MNLARLDGGRPVDNPRGFVTTVVNNLVLSRLRARKRRLAVDEALRSVVADHMDDRSPERTVIARDALASVMNYLDRLAPRTRAVFIQRRLEHRSTREIARMHGISEEAVLYHLRRATKQLYPSAVDADKPRQKT